MRPQGISVVIPTYNEKEVIPDILNLILKAVRPLEEIIVVDDDSKDQTWKYVQAASYENNKIKLIRRIGERGLVSALREGIARAKGDVVLWLDADFAASELTLERLTESISGCDIALASRYTLGGEDLRKEKIRVMASWLFNKFARGILRTKTRDLTSGYVMAKKNVLDKLHLCGAYGEYCVRFLYQAEKLGLKIKEVPYSCFSRKKGKSKTGVNILVFIRYGIIYTLSVFRIRNEHPRYITG